MPALTSAALTWRRDLDNSGPDGNLMRALVTLTIAFSTGDTWSATPVALPPLTYVGLQNVKAVRGLPAVVDFAGSMDGQIPVIDFSVATAPTLDFYRPGTSKFDPQGTTLTFGTTGSKTITFEMAGNAG